MRPRSTLVALVIATGLTTPPAAPAITAPRADKGRQAALQRAIVRSVNSARAHHRLPAVRSQWRLAVAAAAHSADQLRSGRPSHHSSDGTRFGQRLRRYAPGRRVGETIAWLPAAQPNIAATIVRMWLASPSHRRVLMDRGFRRLGVGARYGMVGGAATTVITADFASAR